MLRYLAIVLLILLIALEVKLWAGEGGMRDVWRLQQRLAEQKAENLKLRQRNDKLAAEVQDLKHGKAAIEARARSEFGLIKPGETFYEVVPPATDAAGKRDDRN